jgi:hypothetical protein
MEKYLYIVEEWNYGRDGLYCIIAKDDDECFYLLNGYENHSDRCYENDICENIKKAKKFQLLDKPESGVIDYVRCFL